MSFDIEITWSFYSAKVCLRSFNIEWQKIPQKAFSVTKLWTILIPKQHINSRREMLTMEVLFQLSIYKESICTTFKTTNNQAPNTQISHGRTIYQQEHNSNMAKHHNAEYRRIRRQQKTIIIRREWYNILN